MFREPEIFFNDSGCRRDRRLPIFLLVPLIEIAKLFHKSKKLGRNRINDKNSSLYMTTYRVGMNGLLEARNLLAFSSHHANQLITRYAPRTSLISRPVMSVPKLGTISEILTD
jgi:hypothetical protein